MQTIICNYNKIDGRRHTFWLDHIFRYSLHKHDANNNLQLQQKTSKLALSLIL